MQPGLLVNKKAILPRLSVSGPATAHLANRTDCDAPILVATRHVATQPIGRMYLPKHAHLRDSISKSASGGHTLGTAMPEVIYPNNRTADV